MNSFCFIESGNLSHWAPTSSAIFAGSAPLIRISNTPDKSDIPPVIAFTSAMSPKKPLTFILASITLPTCCKLIPIRRVATTALAACLGIPSKCVAINSEASAMSLVNVENGIPDNSDDFANHDVKLSDTSESAPSILNC